MWPAALRWKHNFETRRKVMVNVYALKNAIAILWVKACEFDKIDPKSKFVCFSKNNVYAEQYNANVGILFDLKKSVPVN
jgi:hypothetical protein